MITVARYWLLDNKNSANIRKELKIKYCYTDKRISNNVIPTFQSKKNSHISRMPHEHQPSRGKVWYAHGYDGETSFYNSFTAPDQKVLRAN